MAKKYLFVFMVTLLSVCLAGCSHKNKLKKIKQVSLNLDFIPNQSNTRFFYQKDSLYIYSYGYPTHKSLRVFNSEGKLVRRIELNTIVEPKTERLNIKMSHLDSIYILTNPKSLLYLISGNGFVRKKIKLDSIVRHKTIYKRDKYYEMNLFSYTDMMKNNSFLLTAFIMDTTYHPPKDNYKKLLSYNNLYLAQLPRLIMIKNVSDTDSQVIIEPNWVNKTAVKEDEIPNILPMHVWIKDTVICYFWYDRYIYFLNNDLSLRKKIPIYSDFAPIEYPKKKIKDAEDYEINYKSMYTSGIEKVYFDNYTEKYYLAIRLEVPLPKNEKPLPLNTSDYTYSVIRYSKDWQKEEEICIPETDKFIGFIGNGQFVTHPKTKIKKPKEVILNFYKWE